METGEIRLYPGNWLYNAGVIGFLISVENIEKLYNYYALLEDGSIIFKKDIFSKLDIEKRYFSDEKISSIVGNSELYRNYLQKPWKNKFPFFVSSLSKLEENSNISCNLCYRKFNLPAQEILILKNKGLEKFLDGIQKFDIRHNALLGPSLGGFPNGFWNNNASLNICPLCAFLIIHHHLALTKLSDDSEIFINAPSFKIMWYLNKYAQEVYGGEKVKTVREILGMSLVEMALKLNIQLGKWTMMNIEVVSKYKDKIDFFSLPYEVVYLLSNRNIASLLNDIGELSVLNLVLDCNFKGILSLGERIFKISLKLIKGKKTNEKDLKAFLNNIVKLEKNKNNLISFSQKLFKLYALIEEKTKKEVFV